MKSSRYQNTVSQTRQSSALSSSQSGGIIMGVVIGLLVGVGLALLVAWYLTRSQPQEKPGIRAPSAPSFMKPVPQKADKEEEETSVAPPKVDLNRPLQGKGVGSGAPDPIAEIATGKISEPKPEIKPDTQFYVQTGVFNQRADADAQKATLAMQGIQTQLSESSVDGTTVWRVRIGPFTSIEDTASTRSKLTIIGIKPTVIRVNKS
ncbi:MAG: SPOR domain-containing protein [Limnohabitans sp.]|jgi:cell division protein FtsN|nr:SPOR domain-containing protein [Limnohabitans sp.]